MNGATAELEAKMIRKLKSTRTMIIGANQNLFLTFKNSHNSMKIDDFDIKMPPLKLF